jgi:hypothetical protein
MPLFCTYVAKLRKVAAAKQIAMLDAAVEAA